MSKRTLLERSSSIGQKTHRVGLRASIESTSSGVCRSHSVPPCIYENCRRGDKHFAHFTQAGPRLLTSPSTEIASNQRIKHLLHLGRRMPIAGGFRFRDSRLQHGRGGLPLARVRVGLGKLLISRDLSNT